MSEHGPQRHLDWEVQPTSPEPSLELCFERCRQQWAPPRLMQHRAEIDFLPPTMRTSFPAFLVDLIFRVQLANTAHHISYRQNIWAERGDTSAASRLFRSVSFWTMQLREYPRTALLWDPSRTGLLPMFIAFSPQKQSKSNRIFSRRKSPRKWLCLRLNSAGLLSTAVHSMWRRQSGQQAMQAERRFGV